MTPAGLKRLMLDEGLRFKVYNDATGLPIDFRDYNGNPTIGYGRDLIGQGISLDEARLLLTNDIARIEADLHERYPFSNHLPPVWADILGMIEYNTGRLSAWKRLLAAAQAANGPSMVAEILNSDAARGTGRDRYNRFAVAAKGRVWLFTGEENRLYATWM